MLLTESELRYIIRRLLEGSEDEENVLGEPDQSSEDEIESVDDETIDEISAVASAGAGGIRGYSAPMSTKNTKKSRFL